MNPSDSEVLAAVPGATGLHRRPYAYATSCPLTEVRVARPAGEQRLLLKQYPHRDSRPTGDHDPAREIEVYRRILGPAGIGARLHATGRDWLLVELVDGIELWQVGDVRCWADVAAWLAGLHRRFSGRGDELRHEVPALLGAESYLRWLERALPRIPGQLDVATCREAMAELAGLPCTLVHGEFYPSNVLVAGGRVVPVDWETAGVGPGVIDLAALVTGWDDEVAARLVAAYGGVDSRALDCARLALALRWLGGADDWLPPAAHRHDWLGEARAALERLGR